jgi:hypothetical protein
LFVPTTNGTNVTTYAEQVAAANSLGVNDALLVVALEDRTDALSVSNGLPQITNDEIDRILSTGVEPQLRGGDYAGAVIAAVDGLGQAAAASGSTSSGSDLGGSVFLGIIAALLIVVGLYIVFVVVARRRRDSRTAEERDRDTGDLARRANHDLIAADEAVRDGQQDLGFVEAEFDEPDVAPYRTALQQAADEVKAAFAVRQQLDDEVPDDAATRRGLLEEILRHTEVVAGLLKAQQDRLQQLRDVRRRAPEVLQQLAEQVSALSSRLDGTRATVARLNGYAEPSWASVKGHAAEADKRIQFARDAVARGQAALAGQDQRTIGGAIRDAQGALGEATSLLDAVDRLAASLDDAAARLPAELAAAASDVDAARAASASSGAGADQAPKVADAERLLASAREAAAALPPDVLSAFRDATAANAAADSVVAAIREAAAREARRQAVLDGAIRAAAMAVAQAGDFVETRRGGVGREARTRLAEAQRQLDAATAAESSDPDRALAAAQRAQSLANDAYLIASQDFNQFDQRGPGGGYGRGGGGGDAAGAVIGGIIGGILSGGWGGGGWGGTPWGTPPASGGSGGGGIRIGGLGGLGGGGRPVGGTWGGLGGRSRGGRW